MRLLIHTYSLALAGNTIAVTLQPQLYIASAATFIGSIPYLPGFDIMAEIDYLLIKAQIKIIINTNQGISSARRCAWDSRR